MNVNAQKFQSLCELVCKSLAWSNHRTTLPQSALAGCQLPQRGSREGCVPFNVPPGNRNVAGDFHRPYEAQMTVPFPIQPAAQKPRDCGRFSSPLRNSETVSFCHSTGYSLNRKGTGDFHRPYENSEIVSFYHSTGCSLNRGVSGDFHRPYESSETVSFYHSTGPMRN